MDSLDGIEDGVVELNTELMERQPKDKENTTSNLLFFFYDIDERRRYTKKGCIP